MLYAAEMTKSVTQKPVLNTGNFTPESALKAVKEGKTDFILLGRGLLADPEYANKLYYGNREDLRPCIRCNEYCLGMASGGDLGGQLHPASAPFFKEQIGALMDYQKTQLNKLGVEVKLNTAIGADSPELAAADRIIVAVGADALIPPIPGIDKPNIIEVMQAHSGDHDRIGEKVAVVGGGLSGCDCAIDLAAKGREVVIVEMLDRLVPKALFPIAMSIGGKVEEYGITVLTGSKVLAFTDKGVRIENKDGEAEIAADTIILAIGTRSNAGIAKSILDKYTNAQSIGDCVKVGQIGEAVRGGFFAGWTVD